MRGCVAALDGFFQQCNKPTDSEVNNVLAYYSGHYEHYGVNCQAAVAADLQFIFFGVVSPGSTNDNISFGLATKLMKMIENLPLGRYFVADAAYPLSERLLIPFTGAHRHSNPYHDSFNFYLSQLRIRVEMAFGRLVNKFRILGSTIVGSLNRVSRILMACARLHNCIIRQDGLADDLHMKDDGRRPRSSQDSMAPLGMNYLPSIPDDEFVFGEAAGVSHTREEVVEWLRSQQMRRPLHNLERRRRQDQRQQQETERWVMSANADGDVYAVEREFISPI